MASVEGSPPLQTSNGPINPTHSLRRSSSTPPSLSKPIADLSPGDYVEAESYHKTLNSPQKSAELDHAKALSSLGDDALATSSHEESWRTEFAANALQSLANGQPAYTLETDDAPPNDPTLGNLASVQHLHEPSTLRSSVGPRSGGDLDLFW